MGSRNEKVQRNEAREKDIVTLLTARGDIQR